MGESETIVAVISPWDKLSDLVKRKFRVESLPAEKKVMVWREDIHTRQAMEKELKKVGITSFEVRKGRVRAKWQDV
jgi:hypothetical protein